MRRSLREIRKEFELLRASSGREDLFGAKRPSELVRSDTDASSSGMDERVLAGLEVANKEESLEGAV